MDNMNDYLKEEFVALHPTQITACIENVRFSCFVDSTFSKAHPTPALKQLDGLHFHTYYELFCVKNGSLKIKFENGETVLKDGETAIVAPKVFHRSFIEDSNVLRFNLNFVMEKISTKSDLDLYGMLIENLATPFTLHRSKSIVCALENMAECLRKNERVGFSLRLMEIINEVISSAKNTEVTVSENSESRIYKIHHIINLHYADDLKVSDLAKTLFLSERQVRRIIQKYHNCSFSELICQMRMKASAEFLNTTDMKVSDIASRVGFSSLSGFYDAFKKHYGVLPLAYRKRHLTANDNA